MRKCFLDSEDQAFDIIPAKFVFVYFGSDFCGQVEI